MAVENLFNRRGAGGCGGASMRPRLHGRGERGTADRRTFGCRGLQCGHGYMAVENFNCAAFLRSAMIGLQCGHGYMAVENLEV